MKNKFTTGQYVKIINCSDNEFDNGQIVARIVSISKKDGWIRLDSNIREDGTYNSFNPFFLEIAEFEMVKNHYKFTYTQMQDSFNAGKSGLFNDFENYIK